jgi:hypothetical protein
MAIASAWQKSPTILKENAPFWPSYTAAFSSAGCKLDSCQASFSFLAVRGDSVRIGRAERKTTVEQNVHVPEIFVNEEQR